MMAKGASSASDWRPSERPSSDPELSLSSEQSRPTSIEVSDIGDLSAENQNVQSSYLANGKGAAPVWAWVALVIAIIACSSGGIWFALLDDCPPILRASWRLGVTTVLQFPGWVRDYNRASSELIERYRWAIPSLTLSGLALAAHFSFWSISLNLTSLSHSLLFVCTTPILLVTYQALGWFALRRCFKTVFKYPPTWIEVIGTFIGFLAAALLAEEAANASTQQTQSSTSAHKDPSLIGDLVATLGAATMGIYLMSGASLRAWLPVWLYVFPVTAISALFAAIVSLIAEPGVTLLGVTSNSLFGLFGDARRFGLVFGSALTSGILGHTLANLALEHISPLIISVLLLNEPLIGSLLGFIVGVQGAPSMVTMLAGIPLMLAAGLVALGGRDSELFHKCSCVTQECNNRRFQVVDSSSDAPVPPVRQQEMVVV